MNLITLPSKILDRTEQLRDAHNLTRQAIHRYPVPLDNGGSLAETGGRSSCRVRRPAHVLPKRGMWNGTMPVEPLRSFFAFCDVIRPFLFGLEIFSQ